MNIFGHALCGTLHIADIRLLMGIQRSGNTDGNGIYFFNERKITCCAQFSCFYFSFQRIADNIADIVLSGIYGIYFFLLNIKADCCVTGAGKFNCQRQANVTKANNADFGCFAANFLEQLRFHIYHLVSLIFR